MSCGSSSATAPADSRRAVTVGDPALTNDAPATGDLDSDGDLDFVWARTGGGVGIQLNDGLGNFAAPFYLSSLPASQPIIADLNGDGRPDLVLPAGAPFLGQSQVLVFLNTCDRPPADLAITLEAPAGPIAEGTTFTYIAQVTNNGPNTATGVQLDVTVLGFGEILSIGGASGCSIVGFGVTCQLGALASGATAAVTVDVRLVSSGSLQAHAGVTATSSDPNPANNAAFTQTAITPGASTLTVTNVSDGGPGSLRLAILRANDGGPRDTIVFNIPGAGVHTIRPPAFGAARAGSACRYRRNDAARILGYAAHRDRRHDGGHCQWPCAVRRQQHHSRPGPQPFPTGRNLCRVGRQHDRGQLHRHRPHGNAGAAERRRRHRHSRRQQHDRRHDGRHAQPDLGQQQRRHQHQHQRRDRESGGRELHRHERQRHGCARQRQQRHQHLTPAPPDNTVGGSTAAARNIISGNLGSGIRIQDVGHDRQHRARELRRHEPQRHGCDPERVQRRGVWFRHGRKHRRRRYSRATAT